MTAIPTNAFQAFVDALPEPALIVASRLVRVSNAPAKAVLGTWIDGSDVRLAIRQPVALERLLGDIDGPEDVELVGLGGHQRRWTMLFAPIGQGARLVRLIDRSEAYAAEQMRVDFVANASHELRTPLATLVGYSESLRERTDVDAETRARFTGIVHDQARRMQRLVEDLISLSRIEGEKFTPLPDMLDIAGLVAAAVDGCMQAAFDRQSLIEVETVNLPDVIPADRGQLLQVLDNLIVNALRYGRAGGSIWIRAAGEEGGVRLSVADEGDGIPAEHIPRLTERFYRVDAGRSRAQGGTGLGLSIVKHIVERHRGRLNIESRIGVGTTVHVLLPTASEPMS